MSEIKSTDFLVAEGSNCISCNFSCLVNEKLTEKCIILPQDSNIELHIDLKINNLPLDEVENKALLDILQTSFISSGYWNQLNYDVEEISFLRYKLKCQLFNIEKQNTFMESNNNQFNNGLEFIGLSKLKINIGLYLQDVNTDLELVTTVIAYINYCIGSVLLDLELLTPFCFSFFARKHFQESYPSMRSISLTLTNNQDRLLSALLLQLNCKICTGHNFLTILKNTNNKRIEYKFHDFLKLPDDCFKTLC